MKTNKNIEKLGEDFLSTVSRSDEIISLEKAKISNLKRVFSDELSAEIIKSNKCPALKKVVDAFGINSFSFYLYKRDGQFIEYACFFKDNNDLFSIEVNSSDFGSNLIDNRVIDANTLLESYEQNLEVDDDDIEAFDRTLAEVEKWINSSFYNELEDEIKDIEKLFLHYRLYQAEGDAE